jgi:hypothetical protein
VNPLDILGPLSALTSPAGAAKGGSALPSISTPIASSATSDLNSSGSYYNLNSGAPINFGPSNTVYYIGIGAALLAFLFWKKII